MSTKHIRGRTLDLGAGNAKYKDVILQYAEKYTAVDRSPGPNVDIVADAHHLSLDNGSFETVICTEVLEHVREPWVVIEEIARVLVPGGRCILTTPFLIPSHSDPYDFYRYTVDGVVHLFERTGMHIVDRARFGGIPIILGESLKFAFCNPYGKRPGRLRRTLYRWISNVLQLCSRRLRQDTIFYAGTYVVAEKPL